MAILDDYAIAIRKRDVGAIVDLMFDRHPPSLRFGLQTENELWDFKAGCPAPGKLHQTAWSELAIDVLAFHNANGGVLILGIADDYSFRGTSSQTEPAPIFETND